jgi:hypothetical protein
MIEKIRWVAANRNSLVALIAEGQVPNDARSVHSPLSHPDEVFIGSFSLSDISSPAIVVLNTSSSREVLAWLAAYSPACFPLSQTVRSLTLDDLQACEVSGNADLFSRLAHVWPCIILGELLGQGEFYPALEGVAHSRANACFSFTYARAHGLYGRDSVLTNICYRRLHRLESDALFVKRSIKIEELKPIWDNVSFNRVQIFRSDDSNVALINLMEEELSSSLRSSNIAPRGGSWNSTALGSGAMESRVRAFEAFLQSMRGSIDDKNLSDGAMLVAAAAILVGNGTSHISLLEDFGKRIPAVFAWFGYFAAKLGPTCWDPAWSRAVNSIGRLTRSRFELADSPSYDLSWLEYDFVKGVPRPMDLIKHVPKLYPRLLSIEVVPGASCQFRIVEEPARSSTGSAPAPQQTESRVDASSPVMREVTHSLYDIERQLGSLRSQIQKAIVSIGEPEQPNLFDPSQGKIFKRNRSSKK